MQVGLCAIQPALAKNAARTNGDFELNDDNRTEWIAQIKKG